MSFFTLHVDSKKKTIFCDLVKFQDGTSYSCKIVEAKDKEDVMAFCEEPIPSQKCGFFSMKQLSGAGESARGGIKSSLCPLPTLSALFSTLSASFSTLSALLSAPVPQQMTHPSHLHS
ncbi:hypothetical protein C0995_014390 [Termitomyces sp. Mi166|nr:hypothetical protein C0995_014390 [Termitomyces sp. Mi166\